MISVTQGYRLLRASYLVNRRDEAEESEAAHLQVQGPFVPLPARVHVFVKNKEGMDPTPARSLLRAPRGLPTCTQGRLLPVGGGVALASAHGSLGMSAGPANEGCGRGCILQFG